MRRLLVLACVVLVVAVPGEPMPRGAAQEETESAVAVRIVPTSFREETGRALELDWPASRFQVVVTNVSTRPVRLWKEWCSWGYFNLSFDVTGDDGKSYVARKRGKNWWQNFPDWTIVPPGDHMVYEVTLDEKTWIDPPLPQARGTRVPRRVKLKAVYEVRADEPAVRLGVWTGRISSPEETYAVYR